MSSNTKVQSCPCVLPQGFFARLLSLKPDELHIWKDTSEKDLGEVTHYGSSPQEIIHMYRVAVYQECIICGKTQVYETVKLFRAHTNI